MTDREKALKAINRWDMELGSASQYYIENGDKEGYDECQENHAIYETIKAALSQEPIADKPTPFLLMERIKDDLWAVEQLLAMREKANEEAWMTIDRMNLAAPVGDAPPVYYTSSIEKSKLKPTPELVQGAMATIANMMMEANADTAELMIGNDKDGDFHFHCRRGSAPQAAQGVELEGLKQRIYFDFVASKKYDPDVMIKMTRVIDWLASKGFLHASQQQKAEWLPIESAPKDGTEFLLCFPLQQNVMILVRWNKVHKYWESKGAPQLSVAGSVWTHKPAAPKKG